MKMTKKILVVGKNSLLAKNFIQTVNQNNCLKLNTCNHEEIPSGIQNYDVVINFSFNPTLYTEEYKEEYDQDLKIARLVKDHKNITLVTLSTRQVYGIHQELNISKESDIDLNSKISTYGLNKIKCENNVKNCIDDNSRILICRGSNIFGSSVGGRNFVGIALNSLLTSNVIQLNLNKKVVKDFLPIELHSKTLESLIINNAVGTYNVGSGVNINLGELCQQFIMGFKSGKIEDSDTINDQFMLDISKIRQYIDLNISSKKILSYAYNIGKNLRDK